MISQDQNHKSNAARIHYEKKRSITVAEKESKCIKKLRGDDGMQMDNTLRDFVTNAPPQSSENVTCNETAKTQPISACNTILLERPDQCFLGPRSKRRVSEILFFLVFSCCCYLMECYFIS